jgi:hypothetical protein
MYWAHGRPDASAATPAPYVLLSTSSASGRKSAMAVVRSSASHGPRASRSPVPSTCRCPPGVWFAMEPVIRASTAATVRPGAAARSWS